jgi:hypothetical protein
MGKNEKTGGNQEGKRKWDNYEEKVRKKKKESGRVREECGRETRTERRNTKIERIQNMLIAEILQYVGKAMDYPICSHTSPPPPPLPPA